MSNSINLPFDEAIDFFRQKINMPTATWTDVYSAEHDKAFMVAGAMKHDLLGDFKQALDKGVAQGTGYEAFRKDFDNIVKKHGWSYNGGAGWRSRIIYDTNMQSSYMAGSYQQMKEGTDRRPYWQYDHSPFVKNPRPEHLAWNGLVLRHDNPFWKTHYPPNGWKCKCDAHSLSELDLLRLGKTKPDKAPAINYQDKVIGKRGPNPRTVSVPEGIDPSFEHAPGDSVLGSLTSKRLQQISQLPADIAVNQTGGLLASDRVVSALIADYDNWVSKIESGDLKGAGVRKNIGVLTPTIKQALELHDITLASLVISINQKEVRHLLAETRKGSKSLSLDMVKDLPHYLARPKAVIWDSEAKHPALLYVFEINNSKTGRITIRVNFKLKKDKTLTNAVRSGSIVPIKNLKQKGMILLEGEV